MPSKHFLTTSLFLLMLAAANADAGIPAADSTWDDPSRKIDTAELPALAGDMESPRGSEVPPVGRTPAVWGHPAGSGGS